MSLHNSYLNKVILYLYIFFRRETLHFILSHAFIFLYLGCFSLNQIMSLIEISLHTLPQVEHSMSSFLIPSFSFWFHLSLISDLICLPFSSCPCSMSFFMFCMVSSISSTRSCNKWIKFVWCINLFRLTGLQSQWAHLIINDKRLSFCGYFSDEACGDNIHPPLLPPTPTISYTTPPESISTFCLDLVTVSSNVQISICHVLCMNYQWAKNPRSNFF